jgi:hypothetical protein
MFSANHIEDDAVLDLIQRSRLAHANRTLALGADRA